MKRISILLFLFPIVAMAQPDLSLVEIADGYTRPCEIVHAGDERLFVVEQTGRIKILYTDGETESTPFLNISDRVDAAGNEKGLLGLAFPPDYCSTGFFYVNYTTTIGGQLYTRISRFSVDPEDENLALADSEDIMLLFEQDFSNHNGGQLEFGPDGYLYIATGDGGSGGDPNNRAQDLQSYLGKMLRIDVSGEDPTIPADNPFADDDFALDEIWSYGLRNPWKFAFDSETGDMYIGDVGQSNREEVSYQAAGTPGGLNFGWRCYEGNETFNTSGCDDMGTMTFPIHDYAYGNGGNGFRCAITGGRVYRGNSFPEMYGKYLYADYCSDEYWLISPDGDDWLIESGTDLGNENVSFGEDVWGEMYAVSGNGDILRVEEASGELRPHILQGNNTLTSALEGSSYAWYLDGALIDGSNSQTITADANGSYVVVITSASGCEITSNAADITLSLTDHNALNQFEVYPNPTNTGMVSVKIELASNFNSNTFVQLMSIDGKSLDKIQVTQNSNAQIVDLSDVKAGIYFIRLTDVQGQLLGIRRLIVN